MSSREHSFGWMIGWHRLVRNYDKRLDTSETPIDTGMGAPLHHRSGEAGAVQALE